MNYSIAADSPLAEDDVCHHDETEVRRVIIGTGQAGPPLAKRLSEAVPELIQTMLEALESSAA